MAIINRKIVSYVATSDSATTPTIDLSQQKFIALQNSADTTAITFYGCTTSTGTFGIIARDNTALTITTSVTNGYYTYSSDAFDGVKFLRIVKATGATITIVTEVI